MTRLAYIGNMSRSYDLKTVVETVAGLEDVTLDLAGGGPDEPALRALAATLLGTDPGRLGTDPGERLRFHGYLDEKSLASLLDSADVGLIPMFPDSEVAIPGKLADYLRAGLPVVCSLTGEVARLIADYRAGLGYEAGRPESLAAVLGGLAGAGGARRLAELAAGARRLYEAEFSAAKVYPAYVRFCYNIHSL